MPHRRRFASFAGPCPDSKAASSRSARSRPTRTGPRSEILSRSEQGESARARAIPEVDLKIQHRRLRVQLESEAQAQEVRRSKRSIRSNPKARASDYEPEAEVLDRGSISGRTARCDRCF